MAKIYVGQTDLTIQLVTGKDITNVQSVKIKYKNPLGVLGEFTASIVNASTGIIKYDILSVNDINMHGTWILWAKIVDFQGLVSIGEATTMTVYKESF